ncbi:ATP-binding protein [bacterium]|nr:ATP-binding protein [bacterium]
MKLVKNFRLQVLIRLALISISICLLAHLISRTSLYITMLIVAGLTFYQVWTIISFIEKSYRDLGRFLYAIRHADFSQSFALTGLGPVFDELSHEFSEVIREFQQNRAEKEEQYRYLQTVIHHVGIGLLSFQSDGKVDLLNTTAKQILKVSQLSNIKVLTENNPELVNTLFHLRPGSKALVKFRTESGEQIHLSIFSTEFRLRNQKYTLVSLQDIHRELEDMETEAWQNLIRVLTHEIMNSMTPISSLSSTAVDLLDAIQLQPSMGKSEEEVEKMRDINSALRTIHKRSLGLMQFVKDYRNLTLIPNPQFRIIQVSDLFARVQQLMENTFNKMSVEFIRSIEPRSLEITTDPTLLEQVLLNLIYNAVDALRDCDHPRIELQARMNEGGRIEMQVMDNGPGIVPEAIGKIFIPFFTTKKEGSGIGLSFSRQAMRLLHGSISVHSIPGQKTTFTLLF